MEFGAMEDLKGQFFQRTATYSISRPAENEITGILFVAKKKKALKCYI